MKRISLTTLKVLSSALVVGVFVFGFNVQHASATACSTTGTGGLWSATTTWASPCNTAGTIPGANAADTVTVVNGSTLTADVSKTITTLTVSAPTGSTTPFQVSDGITTTVTGTTTFNGPTATTNTATISLNTSGALSVGALTIVTVTNRNVTIAVNTGTLTVGGAITFSGSGTRTISTSGTSSINFNGATLPTGGTISLNTATTLTTTGSTTISGAYTLRNVIVSSGTLTISGSTTVTGDLTNNGRLAYSGTPTFTMGLSGASTSITTTGSPVSTSFYNLTIPVGAKVTLGVDATVANNFTISAAGSTETSLTHSSGADLSITGTATITEPSSTGQTLWKVNDGSATVTGATTIGSNSNTASRVAKIILTTGTMQVGVLNFHSGTTDVTVANSVLDLSGGASTFKVSGTINRANKGTITPGTTSTFIFNGSSTQVIPVGSGSGWGACTTQCYANLTILNTAGATISTAITSSNISGSIVVGDDTVAAILDNNGAAIAGGSGDSFIVNNLATFKTTGSAQQYPTGFTTITFDPNSTMEFDNTSAYTIGSGKTYGNVAFKPTTAGLTFPLPSSITINGGLTIGNGTNAVTVTADTNDPPLNIGGSFTVNNGGTFIAPQTESMFIAGDMTIGTGTSGVFTENGGPVSIGGNLTIGAGATFTDHPASSLIFDGGTTQTITDNTSPKQDLGNVITTAESNTYLLDFGLSEAGYPTSTTGWNDITDPASGSAIPLVTSTGAASSATLQITNSFFSVTAECSGYSVCANINGTTSSSLYPATATKDNFFLGSFSSTDNSAALSIGGLNDNYTYDFKFYASRIGLDSANRTTNYTIGSTTVMLNATDSVDGFVRITDVAPTSGSVDISIVKNASATYGYLGVLEITEHIMTGSATVVTTATDTKITTLEIGTGTTWNISNDTMVMTGTSGTLITNNGTFTSTGSTVSITGSGDKIISSGNPSFNNLTVATSNAASKFNFSLTAASVSGWNNVIGDPALAVRQTIDSTTGMGVRSVPSAWNTSNGDNAFDGWGESVDDGGGFAFPAGVVANYWYNSADAFASNVYQAQLFGLDPSKTYTVEILGSRSNANSATAPRITDYNIKGAATAAAQSLNAFQNTSGTVVFSNIQPDAEGVINVGVNKKADGTGGNFGYLNGLTVTADSDKNNLVEDLTVNGTLTVNSGATLSANGSSITATGSISNAGTFIAGGSTTALGYYRPITINHAKVPNSDQFNFPMLITGTFNGSGGTADLRKISSGGKVQNANGYDIQFFADPSLSVKLNWEVEKYVSTTGELEAWVKVPRISHLEDTTIYMSYGDPSVTTFQGGAANTWDNDYKLVYHLPNGSTLSAADSTGNSNDGAVTSATATTGQIDGGANFNGSTTHIDKTNYTHGTSNITISTWVYSSNFAANQMFVQKDPANADWSLFVETGAGCGNDTAAGLKLRGNGCGIGAPYPSNSVWHYIVGTINGTNGVIYVDGARTASATMGAIANTTNTINIGRLGGGGYYLNGKMDEIHISDVARRPDWISTEYFNQNSPSTFSTVGSETAKAATAGTIATGGDWTNTGTFSGDLSTVKLTNTGSGSISFAGGGATYNNVWLAHGSGTGSYTISGNNTFNDFKDDGTGTHSLLFTSGSTQHFSSWSVSGTSGHQITINSTDTGTHTLVKDGSGAVNADYLNIQHSIATPQGQWFAGDNSTDNNSIATAGSGWTFKLERVYRGGGGGSGGESQNGASSSTTGGTGENGGSGAGGESQNGGGTPTTGGESSGGGGGDSGFIFERRLLAWALPRFAVVAIF